MAEGEAPQINRQLSRSLSTRLLLLTTGFVMLAEVLIFLPSVAQFRVDYFRQRMEAGHLALLAIDASRGQIIGIDLQSELLRQAGALGISSMQPGRPMFTLGPEMPGHIETLYDLRMPMYLDLVQDAMRTLTGEGNRIIAVTGYSPADPSVTLEVVLEEQPLREAMRQYALNIFWLSLVISAITAALVFFSLQWLMVRPMSRLTANMIAFQAAPDDTSRIISPSGRPDEIGQAERTLADMQAQLHESLSEKARLAGVGEAVTKISHDLKNILTTAQLESDRLEMKADEETRKMTSGIVRALDRAVDLCTKTLKFAKEGPVAAMPRKLPVRRTLEDSVDPAMAQFEGTAVLVQANPTLTWVFDPDLTARALDNLVRNALGAGATEVMITVEPDDGILKLMIEDDGPGLPEKAKENLFQPFQGSARAGGTGLGLPIALECVQAQGGTLDLVRTSDLGTTFLMVLPGGEMA